MSCNGFVMILNESHKLSDGPFSLPDKCACCSNLVFIFVNKLDLTCTQHSALALYLAMYLFVDICYHVGYYCFASFPCI